MIAALMALEGWMDGWIGFASWRFDDTPTGTHTAYACGWMDVLCFVLFLI